MSDRDFLGMSDEERFDSLLMEADIANQEARINSAVGPDVGTTDNHWADRRPIWELPDGGEVRQNWRLCTASLLYDAALFAVKAWDKDPGQREAARGLLWKAINRAAKEEA